MSMRSGSNTPRQYTEEEVGKIRKILMLRSLDIPVLEIKELLEQKDLLSALLKRKRKLNQQIERDDLILHKLKQLQSNTQMNTIDLSSVPMVDESKSKDFKKVRNIATLITNLFLDKDFDRIVDYFEDDKKNYITDEYLKSIWEASLVESGEVNEIRDIFAYSESIVNAFVHCTNANILVKYCFYGDKIRTLSIDTIEE